jgi:hypothetical protein
LTITLDAPVTKSQPKEPTMTNIEKSALFDAALAAYKDGDSKTSNALYAAYRAAPNLPDIAKAAPEPSADTITVAAAIHETVMAVAEIESLHPRNASRSITDLMLDVYKSKDGALLYDLARSPYGTQPMSKLRTTVNKARGGELSGVEAALRSLQSFQARIES